jgi:hypothetical protein
MSESLGDGVSVLSPERYIPLAQVHSRAGDHHRLLVVREANRSAVGSDCCRRTCGSRNYRSDETLDPWLTPALLRACWCMSCSSDTQSRCFRVTVKPLLRAHRLKTVRFASLLRSAVPR